MTNIIDKQDNRWMLSWIALTIAFAFHVWDEAAHDFLSWYNPTAQAIRGRLGESFFPPVFTFSEWLIGLCAAIAVFAALAPLLRERRGWLIVAAYVYAVIHILNGFQHITMSASLHRLTPGTISSPLLLLSAVWLFVETNRVRRSHG